MLNFPECDGVKASNSSICTEKHSNIQKPNAKLAKPMRIRTCTLEGYRDKALDAFRRGVENTVKDCEGILNRAITMALLDSGSAPGVESLDSSASTDLEAKLLCTAGDIKENSKAITERYVYLSPFEKKTIHSTIIVSILPFYIILYLLTDQNFLKMPCFSLLRRFETAK